MASKHMNKYENTKEEKDRIKELQKIIDQKSKEIRELQRERDQIKYRPGNQFREDCDKLLSKMIPTYPFCTKKEIDLYEREKQKLRNR
jgi:predicted RNase H-like nuclease (RuvC/YqgF family)